MVLDKARDVMTVVAMSVAYSKEVLPALFSNVRCHNIGILIVLLGVWNKTLLAAVRVAHYILEVPFLSFAGILTDFEILH